MDPVNEGKPKKGGKGKKEKKEKEPKQGVQGKKHKKDKEPKTTPEHDALVTRILPNLEIDNKGWIKTIAVNDNPIFPDSTFYDVGIAGWSGVEDSQYGEKPQLVKHIRRGNTFMVTADKVVVMRKGMPKFFDL